RLAVQQLQRPPVGLQISNCISFDLRSDEKHSRSGCWRRGQRADLRGYSGTAIWIGEAEQNDQGTGPECLAEHLVRHFAGDPERQTAAERKGKLLRKHSTRQHMGVRLQSDE